MMMMIHQRIGLLLWLCAYSQVLLSNPFWLGRVTPCVVVQAQSRSPNFVFLFADDLGFGDLACYGHPYAKTPNLDRLAAQGTLFRQFHVNGNVCPVTRAGLMTGRNPSWFPNYTDQYSFMGATTITNILHDAGYVTGHIGTLK